jgi:SAM-dependent methyltransferase
MAEFPLGWDELFRSDSAELDAGVAFYGLAHALAAEAKVVIDVGCGRGAAVDISQPRPLQDLRAPGRRVVGIDVDAAGSENPVVDEFRQISDSSRWPVGDGEADLVVSDWTLEHIADPGAFVSELTRALRPGGVMIARSVGRYSALALGARAVPNDRHSRVLRILQPGRHERDVFPTAYRMNGRRALARLLDADYEWATMHGAGLFHYLQPWPALARAAATVEPRLPRAWRTVLIVFARKRG